MDAKEAITKEKKNRSHYREKFEDKKKKISGKMFAASIRRKNI